MKSYLIRKQISKQFPFLLLISTILLTFLPIFVQATTTTTGAANYYEMKPNPYYISLGVKGYQQTEDYTCGPAAVMSLLRWYNILQDADMNHETEMRIAKEMGTIPGQGTKPKQIIDWLQAHGLTVESGENGTLDMLHSKLKNGKPAIVLWLDWGGHWFTTTGYYAEKNLSKNGVDTIFFADPAAHWFSPDNPAGISSFNAVRFADMWKCYWIETSELYKNFYIIATPVK